MTKSILKPYCLINNIKITLMYVHIINIMITNSHRYKIHISTFYNFYTYSLHLFGKTPLFVHCTCFFFSFFILKLYLFISFTHSYYILVIYNCRLFWTKWQYTYNCMKYKNTHHVRQRSFLNCNNNNVEN